MKSLANLKNKARSLCSSDVDVLCCVSSSLPPPPPPQHTCAHFRQTFNLFWQGVGQCYVALFPPFVSEYLVLGGLNKV